MLHRCKYFGAVFAYLVTVNLPNLIAQDFIIGVNVRQAVLCRQVLCAIYSHLIFRFEYGGQKYPLVIYGCLK